MGYKIKRILVGTTKVRPYNFATQGPCPDGFHVPLLSEFQSLINAGISLGAWTNSNGSGMKTYLKMPYNGSRSRSNTIDNQGSVGYYYTSSANTGNSNQAYCICIKSSAIEQNSFYRSLSSGIRAFKNTPVVPDSSWTKLKAGTGSAGIYYKSALGLISISSDGTNWITIADKNLGATTVYSDGDTLSEANCGKYYQWGNNYGFAWTGSITTSTSQVNAQNYGPGNYYSSSTFIVRTGSPAAWDSSGNNNLRGGVNGNVPV